MIRAALIAVVGAALVAGACRPPPFLSGPRLTGTCAGACDHYFACRGGAATEHMRTGCVADCHGVFSDAQSLAAFESLSCEDAIEYVEGSPATTAADHETGSPVRAAR